MIIVHEVKAIYKNTRYSLPKHLWFTFFMLPLYITNIVPLNNGYCIGLATTANTSKNIYIIILTFLNMCNYSIGRTKYYMKHYL